MIRFKIIKQLLIDIIDFFTKLKNNNYEHLKKMFEQLSEIMDKTITYKL
jgi:ribosomal protein S17E